MKERLICKTGLAALVAAAVLVPALQEVVRPTMVIAAAGGDKKAAGAVLFATRGCAHCHGDNGQGTERGPGLQELRKKLSAEKVHDQIVHGGGGMPAFADALTPDETDDLVQFLRAKKWITPPAVPPAETTPAPATPAAAPAGL